eukprot:scaffold126219_cov54-Phaeocystis_antarctica.AAC.2
MVALRSASVETRDMINVWAILARGCSRDSSFKVKSSCIEHRLASADSPPRHALGAARWWPLSAVVGVR